MWPGHRGILKAQFPFGYLYLAVCFGLLCSKLGCQSLNSVRSFQCGVVSLFLRPLSAKKNRILQQNIAMSSPAFGTPEWSAAKDFAMLMLLTGGNRYAAQ